MSNTRSNDCDSEYVIFGMGTTSPQSPPDRRAVLGCLIGTAVGDALGLPYEGLSPRRAQRMLGAPDRYRFLFRRGMVSDDTEHMCMVLQSLLGSQGEIPRFRDDFASRLKWWMLSLPAGTGLATARAIFKLWVGFSPTSSGVYSAGNGPAMRAAILGVMLPLTRLLQYVSASSQITHTDPKATYGAIAVALASHLASHGEKVDPSEYLKLLTDVLKSEQPDELLSLMQRAIISLESGASTFEFSSSVASERGVTGYVYHTVPVAVYAWLKNQHDFRAAIQDVISCGGDADTTAAIVGGIVGAAVGIEGIPEEWQHGILDWPLSINWIRKLGHAASEQLQSKEDVVPSLPFLGRVSRNLLFLLVVLAHGFRRLAPPY